jgi:hypothetical protein
MNRCAAPRTRRTCAGHWARQAPSGFNGSGTHYGLNWSQVAWVDDSEYYVGMGDVRCATNTKKTPVCATFTMESLR